jgi:multiple sugar transport system substrate-binding protein
MALKNMTRRALLAAAASISLLATGAAGAADQIKLSFLAAEYSAASLPFWEKTVAAFEAANPDVDVTLEVVGWNTMHDTTAQRIAAGTMPDLVNTATIWVPEWVDADAIRPLDKDLVSPEKQADFVRRCSKRARPTRARTGACRSRRPRARCSTTTR